MKLTVNGEAHEHRGDGNLLSLLGEMGVDPERVAVMVNGEVVPRSDRAGTRLDADARVEIVTFAQGG